MAQTFSFDVSTGADLQEVDNAVNQARKEVTQRYDFKGAYVVLEFDRAKPEIRLEADDDFKMKALYDVLHAKLVKRGVPVKNLVVGDIEPAAAGHVRRTLGLTQGLAADAAKAIVKEVKAQGFKKLQVAIQGEELRVSSASKDVLQDAMQFLRSRDFGVELQFGNYR